MFGAEMAKQVVLHGLTHFLVRPVATRHRRHLLMFRQFTSPETPSQTPVIAVWPAHLRRGALIPAPY